MKNMLYAVLTTGLLLNGSALGGGSGAPQGMPMQSGQMSPNLMNKPMGQWTMQDMMQMMGMPGMGDQEGLSGRAFDRAFVAGMIVHHQNITERSRQAGPGLKDPQVKAWAARIVKAQEGEIRSLRTLLSSLGGSEKDVGQAGNMGAMGSMGDMMGGMSGMMGGSGSMEGMSEMSGMMGQKAGSGAPQDPNRAYVEAVLAHHAAALEMASAALRTSTDARVLQVARNILVNQSSEIVEFKAWLKRQ